MSDTNNFSLFNPSSEHKALREMILDFVKKELEPQALEFDKKEEFNLELFRKLGQLGLLGLLIKEEDLGGSNMDLTAMIISHEELSSSDPGFCLAYLAHSVLCGYNIYRNANEDQKKKFLPGLSSGEKIGAMAMSEPDCGTDALAMKTHAIKKDSHYILNGRKMWITNGCIDNNKQACDYVLVYAKTGEKISSFIVEKSFKGFSVGQKIGDKLGMRASNTAELVFENCEVPKSHLIGEEGDSLIHMMQNLEVERLALAGMSLGIAKRCLEIMNKYSLERQSFKKSIRSFGQIQKYLAKSYAEYQSIRSYIYNTARQMKLEPSKNHRLDCDAVKLLAGELGKVIADRAIQVLGGYGYVGEYVVERLWRDAKLLEIGGGTNEALEKNITKELENL
ncbi:MAG: acyl-CoA dehydrogenase family protein [Bdellovibrionaceae bacterium]|nr:acyl-CoA dehydrogenase family protein [Pseudobdellovibrionaceae bacterium]